MTARAKAWICSHSLAGIAHSNPAGGMDVFVVCCRGKSGMTAEGVQNGPKGQNKRQKRKHEQKKIPVGGEISRSR